jgi:hypothetical protein
MTWSIGGLQSIDANQRRLGSGAAPSRETGCGENLGDPSEGPDIDDAAETPAAGLVGQLLSAGGSRDSQEL